MAEVISTTGGTPSLFRRMLRLADMVATKTISAAATITANSGHFVSLNGGAANRNVDFVAGSSEQAGMWFFVKNHGSTNNLVIRDSAASTLATLTPGQWAFFAYTGSAWQTFNPATVAAAVTSIAPTSITLTDNTASALDITEGANSYIKCVTTDGSESVTFGKSVLFNGGIAPGSRFTSTEQTGTGSSQNIAHGLGSTPSQVTMFVSDSGATGIYTAVPGAHDATNIKFTVTAGVKFYVQALK
jgi:hypothetical protein